MSLMEQLSKTIYLRNVERGERSPTMSLLEQVRNTIYMRNVERGERSPPMSPMDRVRAMAAIVRKSE